MSRACPPAALVFLAAIQFAEPAFAQTDADRATARELAKEGAEALEKKDYKLAADRFTRADALFHAPTLVLGLARAQVGLGQLVAAQENFNRVLREELPPNPPDAYVEAINDAKKDLAALAPQMSWVIISMIGPKDASGATVKADQEEVPQAAWGVRRAIDPGEHVISVELPGYFPAQQKVQVAQGSTQEVKLELKPKPPSLNKKSPSGEEGETPWRGFFPHQEKVGLVFLSVGAAVLVDGLLTGAIALDIHNQLERGGCNETGCPSTLANERDSYRTLATVSTASFIGGGIGFAAGLLFVLSAPRKEERAPEKQGPKAFHIEPYAGLGHVGVWGTF